MGAGPVLQEREVAAEGSKGQLAFRRAEGVVEEVKLEFTSECWWFPLAGVRPSFPLLEGGHGVSATAGLALEGSQ